MAPLRARAPLDVDLEDKLIFGLTPVRFGYLAVGALGAYVLGAHLPLPGVIKVPAALMLLAGAAAVAWVKWRGRPLDAWLLDAAIFARRNFAIDLGMWQLRHRGLTLPRRRRPRVPTIAVLADRPGAGATTVAVELGAALALKGRRVDVAQTGGATDAAQRLGLPGPGTHGRTGLRLVENLSSAAADCVVVDLGSRARKRGSELALVVASGGRAPDTDARRRVPRAAHIAVVVNRDREGSAAQGEVAVIVPEDPSVPAAQESHEPVILQFPTSRAAQAFRRLADQVDPRAPEPWHRDSDRPRAG